MSPKDQETKFLQIELTAEIYDALMARVQLSGNSASELVQESLGIYLGGDNNAPNQIETRLAELESRIMQRVEAQVETQMQPVRSLVQNLQSNMRSQSEAIANIQTNLKANLANPKAIAEPSVGSSVEIASASDPPTSCERTKAEADSPSQIGPLQVGDVVQVRDPDSPHYMEQLRISAVGIIRATVQTDSGEQTFLKRDLRFVRSASASTLGSD